MAIPTKTRLVVKIDRVIIPSTSVILHIVPSSSSGSRIKSHTYTLGQLHMASETLTFNIVSPISLLEFDHSPTNKCLSVLMPVTDQPHRNTIHHDTSPTGGLDGNSGGDDDDKLPEQDQGPDAVDLAMLEASQSVENGNDSMSLPYDFDR